MIDTCVTPKNKPFKPSHTFVYTIATMSAECVFRFSNFKIRGTFHSSVLLVPVQTIKISLGSQMECMQIVTLCVLLSHIGINQLNLLKAILRIKLDQYARSVRANVLLNIQIVVCGCTLNDSQQVH